jgi:dynein heavy chain
MSMLRHRGTLALLSQPRLIYTLREYPTTEDFVYLRRFKRYPADCNPYALEVVQFGYVGQSDYYTLSVRGITRYVDGVNAEFASEPIGSLRAR